MESPALALARLLAARREQFAFRVGLAVVSAGGAQALTGWRNTLVWRVAHVAVPLAGAGDANGFRQFACGGVGNLRGIHS